MVKNTTGGNKAKGHARKTLDRPASFTLRVSKDPSELYAQVIAPLGNGMCHVLCADDGVTRLCHIRGKFRGRRKSGNIVKKGSIILIGLRDWESVKDGKIQNCDLLEVYMDVEIDKLKTSVKTVNWSVFVEDNADKYEKESEGVQFTDSNMDEYNALIKGSDTGKHDIIHDDTIIDVDDI
jgi:initiation factor 1A